MVFFYTEEKPIAKSQQTMLTSDSSSSTSSSLLPSSANVARSTGTDVVVRESTDEGKSQILRFLIKNSLAFNVVDDDTWRGLAFGKFRTWSSTSMKSFLLKQASGLRAKFQKEILPTCPGISVTVDDWSDRSLVPWMGITVTTISLDFELRLWSPGMQLIEGEANASNLLSWLSFQLRRLDIKLSHLSSVCTDNASNIFLRQHLSMQT